MLHKCANPVCCAQFRYLHQGKLFEVEIQYFENHSGNGRGNLYSRKGQIERCRLCDRCAAGMALRLDPQHGVAIEYSPGDGEEVITSVILQSRPLASGGIARALLRPLDVDSWGKAKRDNRIESQEENDGMSEVLPVVYVARHGNTAWTLSGQHTGLTDLPLTPDGERNARRLGERLKGLNFAKVFTSPLQRAARTCELSGFGAGAEIDPDLVEWNYGKYEGLTSAQILRDRPDWDLFRDGAPGGESPAQVGERADRVVQRIRSVRGDVLLFSSGHFIRVLTARWLALAAGSEGQYFLLSPASLSALSYERNLSRPVIRLWNDDHHVAA